jgi:ribonucleotide monophosphatase NagD (HAD superfamily)
MLLQNGAKLIATHCDLVCPTHVGPVPDIGSMLAMFKAGLKIKPVKIFGKPNKEMISHIIKRHNAQARQVVIIGDRIYTDMKLAQRAGCDFICTLSGDTKRADIEASYHQPALIVRNIGEILY